MCVSSCDELSEIFLFRMRVHKDVIIRSWYATPAPEHAVQIHSITVCSCALMKKMQIACHDILVSLLFILNELMFYREQERTIFDMCRQ